MMRFFIGFVFMCLLTAPARADHLMPLSDPCLLTEHFEHARLQVLRTGGEALDIGTKADRLRHTSRWRPYKEIESEWADFHARVLATLVELSDFPIVVDAAEDTKEKKAALALVTAYQAALESFANYTSVAVYLERTENDLSSYTQPRVFSFGVAKTEVAASYNMVAKNHFLAQSATADDAFRSLAIPERHYYGLCPRYRTRIQSASVSVVARK